MKPGSGAPGQPRADVQQAVVTLVPSQAALPMFFTRSQKCTFSYIRTPGFYMLVANLN